LKTNRQTITGKESPMAATATVQLALPYWDRDRKYGAGEPTYRLLVDAIPAGNGLYVYRSVLLHALPENRSGDIVAPINPKGHWQVANHEGAAVADCRTRKAALELCAQLGEISSDWNRKAVRAMSREDREQVHKLISNAER
jgi:hypothetical protein